MYCLLWELKDWMQTSTYQPNSERQDFTNSKSAGDVRYTEYGGLSVNLFHTTKPQKLK